MQKECILLKKKFCERQVLKIMKRTYKILTLSRIYPKKFYRIEPKFEGKQLGKGPLNIDLYRLYRHPWTLLLARGEGGGHRYLRKKVVKFSLCPIQSSAIQRDTAATNILQKTNKVGGTCD